MAADHGLNAEAEPALREASFGMWEGMTYEVAMARDRQAMVAFNRDPVRHGPPGGESLTQFAARLRPCFDALVREQRDQAGALLLVTHGGAVRALLCSLLALPLDRHWMLRVDPASLTALDTYPLGPILGLLNDTCHLADLER
jgi:alpha-ribazole phosphatase